MYSEKIWNECLFVVVVVMCHKLLFPDTLPIARLSLRVSVTQQITSGPVRALEALVRGTQASAVAIATRRTRNLMGFG